MNKTCKGKKSGSGKFVAGAVVGAGLGVLFAPKKGSETRAELKTKMDELIKQIRKIDINEVKEEFDAKVAEIKAELADLDKEKILAIAKEKASDLKDKLICHISDVVNYFKLDPELEM